MTFVSDILSEMPTLAKPQIKFLISLLTAFGVFAGRANMTNLHRYGAPSPSAQYRWHKRSFDWHNFNRRMLDDQQITTGPVAAAIDASFLPKSGKTTYGLAKFWDSCQDRAHKGMEISLLALVELEKPHAWALHARQTPAELAFPKNRTSHYIDHLRSQRHLLPEHVKHLLADSLYANFAFVHAILDMELDLVSKLRRDADLRYLYDGPQKKKGPKKRYDGKVDWEDFSRWDVLVLDEDGFEGYTKVVNHKSLRVNIRVVVVFPEGKPEKRRVLMCTDTDISGEQVLRWYSARFQIEFIFRDAKQHTGLCDGQMRSKEGLDFHINASLSALNILRLQDRAQSDGGAISIASIKRRNYNETLINRLFFKLGLDPTCEKVRPHYQALRNFGAIAA